MTIFREAIAAYIREQARPIDKYSHQPRLYHLATLVGAGNTYDDDVLYAAAWLHDLGVFVGHRPEDPRALAAWDNVAYAVERIPGLLEQFGFPAEKTPAVMAAVGDHLPTARPTTIEGRILRDADILEQLGAVGILRTVAKVGRDTRFVTFSDALRALRRAADQLPEALCLPTARELAAPRVQLLRAFLASAEAEADGEPL